MFGLLPITIAEGAAHSAAYEEWRREFPEGLSVFGYRHMTPEQPFGEVEESKLSLEWACECVRRNFFPTKRSRYQAFFGFSTLRESLAFRKSTKLETGIIGSIWEFDAERIDHRGDMRLMTPERIDEAQLRAYWEGKPLNAETAVWECFAVPPVTAVRCVVATDAPFAG